MPDSADTTLRLQETNRTNDTKIHHRHLDSSHREQTAYISNADDTDSDCDIGSSIDPDSDPSPSHTGGSSEEMSSPTASGGEKPHHCK